MIILLRWETTRCRIWLMTTVHFGTSLALGGQGGVTDKVMKAFGQSEQMVFEEDEKATTANKCGMPVKSLKKMTSKTEPRYSR